MCETCRERFDRNPLRVLDCKEKNCQELTKDAPNMNITARAVQMPPLAMLPVLVFGVCSIAFDVRYQMQSQQQSAQM